MKSPIRATYANGSTRQLVAKIVANGWEPGQSIRDFMPRHRKAVKRQAVGR